MTALRPAQLALLAVAAAGAGCVQVGDGRGEAHGTLSVGQCRFNPDTGISATDPYNLRPDFFVGEPLDSNPITAPGFPANQMIIRVQRTGSRIEFADVLMFWILDSAAVARCIHGAPGFDPLLCDRSPAALGPAGEGRLFIGMTYETVFSSFALNFSCPSAYISANALGACTTASEHCPEVTLCPGHGSWISFSRFGNVPADPSVVISDRFRVNDGENIQASNFHVELCDVATVLSAVQQMVPVPAPAIVGTLDGNFEFDLERGQAGQAFP